LLLLSKTDDDVTQAQVVAHGDGAPTQFLIAGPGDADEVILKERLRGAILL
jgi:hypothetical protein